MVPQGPPTPRGGAQSVPASLLRSNSGLSSQNAFPSLVLPHNQFTNLNMFSNVPIMSNLLHQSIGNGGSSSGLYVPGSSQRVLVDGGPESGPLSAGNGMRFNTSSSSYMAANANSSGHVQGQQQFSNPSNNQMLTEQQQAQQLDPQNFQHNQQFSVPNPQQLLQSQQQQLQGMRPGLGGVVLVKLELQTSNEQGSQQLQALRTPGSVKMDPHQLQSMRSLGSVKMEPQQSDSSLFMHHQQQQQQQLQLFLSWQSSQAAAAAPMLQQQRIVQFQHQQQ